MKLPPLRLCALLACLPWLAAGPLSASGRAPGSVLLIAGQSREEFTGYLNDVCEHGRACPLPGGAAFYTSIDLSGVAGPHANEPGDNHQDLEYLKLVQSPLVFQIGLWLSRDQLFEIADGAHDADIARLRTALESLKRPVFLRIGYEFDGPHNRYPPEAYVKAYRVIARALRPCRDIFLVWHSFAMLPTYQEIGIEAWYPGDDYVDWMAISFFQVGEEGFHRAPNREAVLAFARARGKPVLIAEASPIRYTRRQKTLGGRDWWDYWHRPFFELIETHPEIKAVSIINVNWDSQAQHRSLDWGDCRLDRDPVILDLWRRQVAEPCWLRADARLYDAVRELSRPTPAPLSPSAIPTR